MSWDKAQRHLEVEIYPSGTYEWFYVDFASSDRAGTEQPMIVGIYPNELRQSLVKVLEA